MSIGCSFFQYTRSSIEILCQQFNLSPVHAQNIFRAGYKKLSPTPWRQGDFPILLKRYFDDHVSLPFPARILSERISAYDRSVKFLVEMSDDCSQVEMVLMPETKRLTLCLSSQVGCAQACRFCFTGRMGLKRNLSAAEIVAQVQLANMWLKGHAAWLAECKLPSFLQVTNVVFMGMGEPLDNVDAVADAVTILSDPYGPAIPLRKISVSTAGHLPGLQKILSVHPQLALALSIHAAESQLRAKLMPIEKNWPINSVIAWLREEHPQQILIQYTLIQGVNDTDDDARQLLSLLEGLTVKINLIPLNEISPARFTAPDAERLQSFQNILRKGPHRVLVRYSKGQDIDAACGQLVLSYRNGKK